MRRNPEDFSVDSAVEKDFVQVPVNTPGNPCGLAATVAPL